MDDGSQPITDPINFFVWIQIKGLLFLSVSLPLQEKVTFSLISRGMKHGS